MSPRSLARCSAARAPAPALSVATKLTKSLPWRAESKITTGILAATAALTAPTSALSLRGASTMPATPCATMLSTMSIWDLRSSSLSGPFQRMVTPSSCAALAAPAWTLFQNSCVVPLGMTASFQALPGAAPPSDLQESARGREEQGEQGVASRDHRARHKRAERAFAVKNRGAFAGRRGMSMLAPMAERLYLGIDVGTGSARAGLFDAAGRMLGTGAHPIALHRPQEDFVEQSSDDIWAACGASARAALAAAGVGADRVAGLGFDATCSLAAARRQRPAGHR